MKMLFEVMDLAVASPATVSRIGVIYMTPSNLGWMPYVQSWVSRKKRGWWLVLEVHTFHPKNCEFRQ